MLRLADIEPNPHNVRTVLTGVRELAASIERHGLLENLVVTEIPASDQYPGGPAYQLEAGSRRYAALSLLVEQGKRHPDEPVMSLIIGSDGMWENLTENIQRADVHPWDIGRRLHEAECGGMTHSKIGAQIGRSQGWVSRHIAIAKGLHPETIARILSQRLTHKLLQADLFRIAGLLDAYGEPDQAAQAAALDRLTVRRKRSTRRRYTADGIRAFGARLSYLRTQMRIPPTLRPVVAAVLDYVEHGTRLDLSRLELQLLDARKQFTSAISKD